MTERLEVCTTWVEQFDIPNNFSHPFVNLEDGTIVTDITVPNEVPNPMLNIFEIICSSNQADILETNPDIFILVREMV
jgi:hypothetical protein